MDFSKLRQVLHGFRNGALAFALLMFGAVLLGLHVARISAPQRFAQRPPVFHVVEQIRAHQNVEEQADALVGRTQETPVAVPHVTYDAAGLRDPFIGPLHRAGWAAANAPPIIEEPPMELPSLIVQGVVWGGSEPFAIVNNETVRAGDTIQGVKVLRIERDGIVVTFQGEELRYEPGEGAGSGSLQRRYPMQPPPPSVGRYF